MRASHLFVFVTLIAVLLFVCPSQAKTDEQDSQVTSSDQPDPNQVFDGQRPNWIEKYIPGFFEWAKENDPEMLKELDDLRLNDPEKYFVRFYSEFTKYRDITETAQQEVGMDELLKEDEELVAKSEALVQTYNEVTSKKEKAIIRRQLKELVEQRFDNITQRKDIRYQRLLQTIEKMKARAEQGKAEIEQIKAGKDEYVELRLKELLKEQEQKD